MANEETGTMDMAQMVRVLLEDRQKRDQELAEQRRLREEENAKREEEIREERRRREEETAKREEEIRKNVEDVTKKRLSGKKRLECKWSYFEVF